MVPAKKLGQNFLLSQKAIRQIIELARLQPTDIVLEIGAGKGTLTERLLEKARRVIAVEKDRALATFLKKRFQKYNNLTIITGDIRDYFNDKKNSLVLSNLRYKVVSNPPYYLSSYILRRFLEIENKPEMMVLTLQKELAERVCQEPAKMSIIAAMVRFYGEPHLGPVIKKSAFYPSPKVDSQILVIKNVKKPQDICEKDFFRILKIGFSNKRKMLAGNLKNGLGIPREEINAILRKLDINEKARAQELSIEEWKRLTQKLLS